ncbi:hypothetical protein Tsp_01831 [Trichinella spiralis]|uniref:Ionotropic glutamate receptor C-terminal domain-containing protein n=1 Tax=Trichinella spiralis TaxID=6334 RepID=E5SDL8_TRISP|nr:hypothetical protein Tsp_01831 [Trichinella spiralis]KRY28768.1 hypothetical protein T01_4806 [Trichinella spiralis]
MENSVLRVGVSVWDYMNPECVSSSRGCNPGPELEIIYLAAQMMNLSIEFVLSNEKGCGIRKQTPGSPYWTSLMGMLARNEIDITGNICYLMQERLQSFNASTPIWISNQAFLIKKPIPPSVRFKAEAPFHWKAWLFVLFCMLCCVLIWSFYHLFCAGDGRAALNSFHDAWDIFLQFKTPPRSMFWLCNILFFVTLKIYYTSYIRVSLLYPAVVQRPFKNIVELADLMERGEYRLMHYHQPKRIIFEFCPPETCLKLQSAIEKHGIHHVSDSSPKKLLQTLIDNDQLVLISNHISLEFYLSKFPKREKLWLITDTMYPQLNCYFWNPSFGRKKEFDNVLTIMSTFKMNVLKRYVDSTMTDDSKQQFLRAEVSSYDQLSLAHAKHLFIEFGVAVLFSTVVFVLEALLEHWVTTVLSFRYRFNLKLS